MHQGSKAVESLGFVVALLTAVVALAEPNVVEGTWEVKGEMTMEGLPFKPPAVPLNYSVCLTKKDLVPQQKEKDKDCTQTSQKVEGDTVTWATTCVDKKGNKTESTGSARYQGSTFERTITSATTGSKGGTKVVSKMQLTGHRTGDCK